MALTTVHLWLLDCWIPAATEILHLHFCASVVSSFAGFHPPSTFFVVTLCRLRIYPLPPVLLEPTCQITAQFSGYSLRLPPAANVVLLGVVLWTPFGHVGPCQGFPSLVALIE